MNVEAEIAALKAKREALEKQLLVQKVSEQKELALRNQIVGIGTEITALYGHLTKAPDQRGIFRRARDQIVEDPVKIGAPAVTAMSIGLWSGIRFYMLARHQFANYTAKQLVWREWIFCLNPKYPASITKVGGFSALLLVLQGWTQSPPRS